MADSKISKKSGVEREMITDAATTLVKQDYICHGDVESPFQKLSERGGEVFQRFRKQLLSTRKESGTIFMIVVQRAHAHTLTTRTLTFTRRRACA